MNSITIYNEIKILHKKQNKIILINYPDKLINIEWLLDGKMIAYDIYGTDLIYRLKVADVKSKETRKLIKPEKLTLKSLTLIGEKIQIL